MPKCIRTIVDGVATIRRVPDLEAANLVASKAAAYVPRREWKATRAKPKAGEPAKAAEPPKAEATREPRKGRDKDE